MKRKNDLVDGNLLFGTAHLPWIPAVESVFEFLETYVGTTPFAVITSLPDGI